MSISCKSARVVGAEARAGAGARYPSHVRRLRCVDCLPVGAVSDFVGPVRGLLPTCSTASWMYWRSRGSARCRCGATGISVSYLPSFLPLFPSRSLPSIHTYIRTINQLTQISPPVPTDMPDLGLHVRDVAETHRHVEKTGDYPAATDSGDRVGGLMRRRGRTALRMARGMARSLRVRTLCAALNRAPMQKGKQRSQRDGWGGAD
jgi:hypothetical protein